MNTDEIKFKQSKALVVVGVALILIGIFINISLIAAYDERTTSMLGQVIMCIVALVIPLFIGILLIKEYIKNGRRMKDILERYGEANILAHIRQNTIGVFQKNQYSDKVYFTDRFVVEPDTAIIDYKEISWMYKHVTHYKNSTTVSIAFALLDGTKFFLCDNADDNDIAGIMQTCQRYNPNIIFGYSKETEAMHEFNVKRYKSGLTQIAHTPISSQEMERSNTYEAGKKQALGGLYTLLCTLAGVLVCVFALDHVIRGSGEIITVIVAIPGVAVGVCMLVSGIEKMQNNKK